MLSAQQSLNLQRLHNLGLRLPKCFNFIVSAKMSFSNLVHLGRNMSLINCLGVFKFIKNVSSPLVHCTKPADLEGAVSFLRESRNSSGLQVA